MSSFAFKRVYDHNDDSIDGIKFREYYERVMDTGTIDFGEWVTWPGAICSVQIKRCFLKGLAYYIWNITRVSTSRSDGPGP